MKQPSDEDLFRRMRSGDRAALETIYQRREPALFRYALHLAGERALAEEAVHDAFLALIQPASRFDPARGTLEGYLYGTVRNLVRALLRKRPIEFATEPAAQPALLAALIGNQRAQALHAAIRQLPDAYRDAVILCDLEERSYEDAAATLGCPLGTVRSRLHRGRALLAEALKERDEPRLEPIPRAAH